MKNAAAATPQSKESKPITDGLLRTWPLPELDEQLGKESRGTVMVVGGSREMPGAAMLAAIAALRAGAGRLQIATVRSVAIPVAIDIPEARLIALRETRSGEIAKGAHRALGGDLESCDALLLGPGMTDAGAVSELLDEFLHRNDHAIAVLDAGALEALSRKKQRKPSRAAKPRIIATPHAGEMAKLCGVDRDEVFARSEELARAKARALGVVIALKGPCTYVAAPDGRLFHDTAGNLGLGTSGSGDTLSGVIAGLCARGADAMQATAWGVHVHAKAGEALARKLGPLGFLARELLGEIPPLLAKLTRGARENAKT
ncbi:MAG: hypothetical protein QOI41_1135 [Myxococcales bacterium]|nr:hypothetical protein [Myxococcales bacterium]